MGAKVRRARWADKSALLAGGSLVNALLYQRASDSQATKGKKGKSVGEQYKANTRARESYGWAEAGSFTDDDISGSRHGTKARPDFDALQVAIRTGRGDVLVLWEIGRSQRDLAVYTALRDLCFAKGLFYWLVGETLYDLRDRNDRMALGTQAVQAEFQADYIRDNVIRGIEGAADEGIPPGPLAYGYTRIRDSRTGAVVEQVLDTDIRVTTDKDGNRVEYTPVEVVREIIRHIADSKRQADLIRSLNDRGIPTSKGKRWTSASIRQVPLRHVYIAKRVLRGKVVGDGNWPALIDEDTFWTAYRILTDPARKLTKDGRAVHLLTNLVDCGVCGGLLRGRNDAPSYRYACLNGCVYISAPILDEYVQTLVVGWLAKPEVYTRLLAVSDRGDERASADRAEVNRLRAELEEWRTQAEAGEVSPVMAGRAEKGLLKRISEAEQSAEQAAIHPALRGLLGPDAPQRWAALGADRGDVTIKRAVIRLVLRVTVRAVGHRTVRVDRRTDAQWLITEPTAA